MIKNIPRQAVVALGMTFRDNRNYRALFGLTALTLFGLYIFLPVWLVAGNSVSFQLSLLRVSDFILFFLLSIVTALLVTMQAFIFFRSKGSKSKLGAVGQGGVSASSALFGGLLATAACSSCIAAIVGFLGAGSIFFVFDYQTYFVGAAFFLVIVGLYLTIRRVNGYCENCEVPIDTTKI